MAKYLKKYWIFGVLAALFMILEVSMDLIQPQLMSTIVDEGVLGLSNNGVSDLNLIVRTGLRMVGFVVLGGCGGVMCGVCENLCSQNFANDVRKAAFERIMSFSIQQTDQFSTGSLITRVTNDVTQIQMLVRECVRGMIRTGMLFAGGIGCMLALNLSFGVVIGCALPPVFLFSIYFITRANPKFTILQNKLDQVNNVMQENVAGSRVVKAYVKETYETKRFQKANQELIDTQLDVLILLSYMTPLLNIIMNIAVIFVIRVGGIQVAAGNITPGIVMAAITYVSQVLNAALRMAMIFQSVSRGLASRKRLLEVLNCEPSIQDGKHIENIQEAKLEQKSNTGCKVEFKEVSFSYPGMEKERILDHVSFTVNPGETIGILGATGCGKSTLVNMIPRFYDVLNGEVLVDEINVKDYSLHELRDKVAIALQQSEIFSTTIRENIQWGNQNPNITEEDIQNAADTAQAMEFIQNQPDRMESQVTQGGHSLSGGQKQRIAIARAILRNAPLLIFDDATSALDLKTEANLYQALNQRHAGQTRIVVAQRIASVKNADQIMVLDNGKIAAFGPHEALLSTSSIYQDIYHSQVSGGEPDARV